MTAAASPIASTTSSTGRRIRPGRIALWTLQVVLVAIYAVSVQGKIGLDPTVVAGFAAMGFGPAGCVTIGVLEALGGAGLLIPRLAGLAATALSALMIGAVIATLLAGGGAMVAIPATVLVLVAVVAVARRRETAELVRSGIARIRR